MTEHSISQLDSHALWVQATYTSPNVYNISKEYVTTRRQVGA